MTSGSLRVLTTLSSACSAQILVCAYLIGSIPFGHFLARIRGGVAVALALDAAKSFVRCSSCTGLHYVSTIP